MPESSWTAKEAQQIGRIEGQLGAVAEQLKTLCAIERRVDSLERFRSYVRGAVALALVIVSAVFGIGCATMNQKCTYFVDGGLESIRTRSTVVGTGETELVSVACADMSYSTIDTGISDNGKDTVLGLGALVKDATPAGAASNAIEAIGNR